jgi:hypothetical protein
MRSLKKEKMGFSIGVVPIQKSEPLFISQLICSIAIFRFIFRGIVTSPYDAERTSLD